MCDQGDVGPLPIIPGFREKGSGVSFTNRTKNRHRCP